MKKVLFLTNYPSPYRVRFYDLLGKEVDLTVVYADRIEKKGHRSMDWYESSQGSYHHVQLQNHVASLHGRDLCLDVLQWLKKPFDHIVICGYSNPTCQLAIFYLRRKKIPFFLSADGGLIRPDSGLKLKFKKSLVGGASGWLTSGKHTTDFFVHYGADRDRVWEYPFTSMTEADFPEKLASPEEKQALRRELGMEEEYILLSIGQFIHRKGFDILMQAAKDLPKNVGVYIVGGLPTEEYEQLHRELGLTNLHFSGFQKREELRKYYEASDLFVLPTREDIWGLVINEAMAYGLPVITTDRCVAGLELVEDGVSGYIVPVEDPEALREKICLALDGDLKKMGQAALAAVKPYTMENMVRAHVKVLG